MLDDQGLVNTRHDYIKGPLSSRQLINIIDINQWAAVRNLYRSRKGLVELQWIKGHGNDKSRGVIRNNQADLVAKASLQLPAIRWPYPAETVYFIGGVLGACFPGNTSKYLTTLGRLTEEFLMVGRHCTSLVLDDRLTATERRMRSVTGMALQISVSGARLHAWRAKMFLDLLPTLQRLHRDSPGVFSNGKCLFCPAQEDQWHLWACPARTDEGRVLAKRYRGVLETMFPPHQVRNIMMDYGWLAQPAGSHLDTITPESQLWMTRGLCPRELVLHPLVAGLRAKKKDTLLTRMSEVMVEGFYELIWIPRCLLVPHPKWDPTPKERKKRRRSDKVRTPKLAKRRCLSCQGLHPELIGCNEVGKARFQAALAIQHQLDPTKPGSFLLEQRNGVG